MCLTALPPSAFTFQPCPWVGPWAGRDLGTQPGGRSPVCLPRRPRRCRAYQPRCSYQNHLGPWPAPSLPGAWQPPPGPGGGGTSLRREPAARRPGLARARGHQGWQERACTAAGGELGGSPWPRGGGGSRSRLVGQQVPGGGGSGTATASRGGEWRQRNRVRLPAGAARPRQGGTGRAALPGGSSCRGEGAGGGA